MKRVLLALCLLFVLAASAGAFTLSGQVTGVDMPAIIGIVAYEVSTGTPVIGVANFLTGNYSLTVAAGGYVVFAYNEIHVNAYPDLDEPRGFYGGQPPVIVQVTSDTSGINIVLEPPANGGFSGAVSYSGTQTGRTAIAAYYTPELAGVPHGLSMLLSTNGNGNYAAPVDSFATYYAAAFMDVNGNLQPDAGEPFGIYGGDAAVPITVTATDFPSGINILMVDPSAAPDPVILHPSAFILSAYPNPFNSTTRLRFTLPATAAVDVRLYDVTGREVRALAQGTFASGRHEALLHGRRAGERALHGAFVHSHTLCRVPAAAHALNRAMAENRTGRSFRTCLFCFQEFFIKKTSSIDISQRLI